MQLKTILASLILIVACSSESDNQVTNPATELVPVSVHIDGFSVSMSDFPGGVTRAATPAADVTEVTYLTLAFYNGATEAYKVTQTKGSMGEGETFGEFNLSLPMGNYTMVAIARGHKDGSEFALTSPTLAAYTAGNVRPTFTATQAVNIHDNAVVNINATLNRIIARLSIDSTDGRSAGAQNVRITLSGGAKAFNPTTGLATTNTGLSNTLEISKPVGQTTSSSTYLFLASDEQNVDVTVETLDADENVLFHKVIEDVPLKRNRITTLSGAMYGASLANAFSINTSWLEDENIPF